MKYSIDRSETMKIWNNEKNVYFLTLQRYLSLKETSQNSVTTNATAKMRALQQHFI